MKVMEEEMKKENLRNKIRSCDEALTIVENIGELFRGSGLVEIDVNDNLTLPYSLSVAVSDEDEDGDDVS